MSKLTRTTLESCCRICLTTLRSNGGIIYNVHIFPNLSQQLLSYLSMKVEDDLDAYPKNICKQCYDKLQDVESFRNIASNSLKLMIEVINDEIKPVKSEKLKTAKVAAKVVNESDNNRRKSTRIKLKGPELNNQMPIPILCPRVNKIKLEPIIDHASDVDITSDTENEPLEYSAVDDDEEDNSADDDSSLVPTKFLMLVQSTVADSTTELNNTDADADKEVNLVKTKLLLTAPSLENNTTDELQTVAKRELPESPPGLSIGLQEMLANHLAELNKTAASDTEHICHLCNKKYSSRANLLRHLKRHENITKYKCKVCGVSKVTLTELKAHMLRHNPNTPRYKCPRCPQVLKQKYAIMTHIRVVHDRIRSYSCGICDKKFGTHNAQKNHEILHTGEKRFVCVECKKPFATKKALRGHMGNHDLSLRRYVCKYCSHRCLTRHNLQEHEVRHEQDLPYKCNVCGLGFVKPKVMMRHQEAHKNSAPPVPFVEQSKENTENNKRKRPVILKVEIVDQQVRIKEKTNANNKKRRRI